MIEIEDMAEAFYNCLKHKRQTTSAMEYSLNWIDNIASLTKRVNDRTYYPKKSICFVVTRPRIREVFAASFEDRIIHHYIALRLEPLLEEIFNPRTFNCRKGKGQLEGVEYLRRDIYEESEGYTRDCYVCKIDLKGFFMSIDKQMMAFLIDEFIVNNYFGADKEELRFLCNVVTMHEPQLDCIKKSPDWLFEKLPDHKTLFRNESGKGLAIGNLFSQLFANFLLNPIDWFIENELGIKAHGRYVDDIYMVHKDKGVLLATIPRIREKLAEYGLQLNESKTYIQHYTKGIRFIGAMVKPGRTYALNKTIGNAYNAITALNNSKNLDEMTHHIQSVNSYLGFLRQYNEYAVRRKLLLRLDKKLFKYIYIKGHYESITIKRKYRRKGTWPFYPIP
jgi:hypothetical protein